MLSCTQIYLRKCKFYANISYVVPGTHRIAIYEL
jgi:hypothetical protein